MNRLIAFSFFLCLSLLVKHSISCTSYLVTPGASVDGSAMISYAADSHIRFGELYYFQGGPQKPGAYFQAFYRGSHKPLAKIPQPENTLTVVGYMNEKQVAIGESTFGGRPELFDTTGMIDYSSLMFVALQWAPTARDAIKVFSELVEKYGYYSYGQSFSIADPYEVWILEMIGKGTRQQFDRRTGQYFNANKGAVWVAIRIPDGYISAHANHARITTFPLADGRTSITNKEFDRLHHPDVRVIYSHDVISFARQAGYFTGKDSEFSFSDVYAPLDFEAARFCEARVWSMFNKVNSEMIQYTPRAMGYDLANRLPLYIKPDRKLSVQDLISFKRDYLQGTEYDMTLDIGGGPFGKPYRWRPLTWEVDGKQYFHERTTATQQTGFSWISQSRRHLPDPIGGVLWFGVDDANLTVYVPMYAGMRRVPESYAVGNGHILEYSDDAAFWVFNKVAHFAYLRYSLKINDIRRVQDELEGKFMKYVPAVDKAALELYRQDPELAKDFLTDFSVKMGNYTVQRWQDLFRFLMVKFIDGNIKKEENGQFLTNQWGKYPIVIHPGYPDWWLRLIRDVHGDRFLVPGQN
ncbi:MAG TPA: C69 family dipeptidase [Bacteroidales bacterium]|nr:C69 family dipeptidase [Bacteroidales bacterium]